MTILEIILIAVGLAADAFAVSVCKGLAIEKLKLKDTLIVGAYFGIFQAAMPLIGYYVGTTFSRYITAFDHWVAFLFLAVIGGRMIYESFKKETAEEAKNDGKNASLAFKAMLPLALATSIDALAVGITFSVITVNIFAAVAVIGAITFILSALGVKLGNLFGMKYKSKAEFIGGVILILIGLKILLEHLGVINF